MAEENGAAFFDILKKYKILFERSQIPYVRSAKQFALSSLQKDYVKMFRRNITILQLRKKIQNMKTNAKKKSEIGGFLNRRNILKDWELKLVELIELDSNKVLNKTTRAIDVSLGVEEEQTDGNVAETQKVAMWPEQNKSVPTTEMAKRVKLSDETEETKNLSLPDLQREVLLKKLKLLNSNLRKRGQTNEENLIELKREEQDEEHFI